jgi:hypothetical protein
VNPFVEVAARRRKATRSTEVHLVFGPSGAGKSTVGNFASRRLNWLHLEIDRFGSVDQPIDDGIDHYNLRTPWNTFWNSLESQLLISELAARAQMAARDHCILTFPSDVVPGPQHLADPALQVHILYGTAADCLRAFLCRESRLARGIDETHWQTHNAESYICFSRPYFEKHRIRAFSVNGRHRHPPLVLAEMRRAVGPR